MSSEELSTSMDYPRGITFEQALALLHETRLSIKELRESQKETTLSIKELRESQKETGLQMKETDKKLERIGKNLGGVSRSLGELIENIIAARLWEKFSEYNYKLRRGYRRVFVYDDNNRLRTDIDILLSDTDVVMAVEVKEEPDIKDVDHHINRMKLIHQYPPAEAKRKKLLGAIAGTSVMQEVQEYAHKAGFFVLELKGEAVALIKPPDDFIAKEW